MIDKEKYDSKAVIISTSIAACNEINEFAKGVLLTRGGRIGSGMGLLLEALWGYYMNKHLKETPIEIGWFPGHQYNDFVCLEKEKNWDPESREGEILRIEVKSMNKGADESKAHFDVLLKETEADDLLLVLVWEWQAIDRNHSAPIILDHFIDSALEIIQLRDALHLERNGSFVDTNSCPDGCLPTICQHGGEPLNAKGKRERLTGPKSTKPSANVSYSANFGGLIRMLKTNSPTAFIKFKDIRRNSDIAHKYISFIHSKYVEEELNQYPKKELDKIASKYDIVYKGKTKEELFRCIREEVLDYKEGLRFLE